MIVKKQTTKSPSDTMRYCEKNAIEYNGEKIAYSSIGTRDSLEVKAFFAAKKREVRKSNINKEKIAIHLSLSFSPKDKPLAPSEMLAAFRLLVYELYGNNVAYICYLHTNKKHPHVHGIISRVKDDGSGRMIDTKQDVPNAMEICRRLEKDRGLVSVEDAKRALRNRTPRITHSYSRTLVIEELWRRLDLIIPESKNENHIVSECKKQGIDCQLKFHRGGNVGVSYALFAKVNLGEVEFSLEDSPESKKWIFKGRTLGRAYMLEHIKHSFDQNNPHPEVIITKALREAITMSDSLESLVKSLSSKGIQLKVEMDRSATLVRDGFSIKDNRLKLDHTLENKLYLLIHDFMNRENQRKLKEGEEEDRVKEKRRLENERQRSKGRDQDRDNDHGRSQSFGLNL